MRDLESRYQKASGFVNRSQYKIFYGQVRPAPILAFGINPGGNPADVNPDGRTNRDGSLACASASFHDNDENDILDCEWKENSGLRQILTPLVGGESARIRTDVVKSNLVFERSARKSGIEFDRAADISKPFVAEIIKAVRPKLVLLTGVKIELFCDRFASTPTTIAPTERDPGVRQIVFAASRVRLLASGTDALVVQVAHASQFGWTYSRYDVASRIELLMCG
jgi:hypothetical protein